MDERYSIEVNDDVVEIYGELTIEEAFDFLNFFEKKGYCSVVIGSQNSTIRMANRSAKENVESERMLDIKDELEFNKSLLQNEKELHEKCKKRLNELEKMLQSFMSEEYQKYKKLHDDQHKLISEQLDCLLPKQELIPIMEYLEK